MKRLLAIGLLLSSQISWAYGTGFFTGRMEYVGVGKLLCEYDVMGSYLTVMIYGHYCPTTMYF